jgi:hypothetical protein
MESIGIGVHQPIPEPPQLRHNEGGECPVELNPSPIVDRL